MPIQKYDITWEHIKGKDNKYADIISRYEIGNKPTRQEAIKIRTIDDTKKWKLLRQEIMQEQKLDAFVQNCLSHTNKKDHDGLIKILTENRWKTPIPKKLNVKTTEMLHEHILHFGTDKLYCYIKENMLMKNAY